MVGNEQFCLVDTDIQQVTQAMEHIIGHFSASQSQPNPITIGSLPERMPQSSEG